MTTDKYPADWDKRRRKVLDRDDYVCQKCTTDISVSPTQAHVHHIKPISEGGGHAYDNLETLCKECHINEHSNGNPKEPVKVNKCCWCNEKFTHFTGYMPGYCSKVCWSRKKAESALNDLNSNMAICSSCHRPFGENQLCKHCGNWEPNSDKNELNIDRLELIAYALRIYEFGESWVSHDM